MWVVKMSSEVAWVQVIIYVGYINALIFRVQTN